MPKGGGDQDASRNSPLSNLEKSVLKNGYTMKDVMLMRAVREADGEAAQAALNMKKAETKWDKQRRGYV